MKAFAQLTLLCWRHSILNLLDRTWLSNKPETATTWMKTAKIVQTAAELASLCRRLVLCAAVTGNCPLIKVNWTQKLVHPNSPRLSEGVSITDKLRLLAEVWLAVPAHPETAVQLPEVTSECSQPSLDLLVWRHTWAHLNWENLWDLPVFCAPGNTLKFKLNIFLGLRTHPVCILGIFWNFLNVWMCVRKSAYSQPADAMMERVF